MSSLFRFIWKEVSGNIELAVLLLAMWFILFEEFNWLVLLSGIIVTILVIIFTDRFLLRGNYERSYIIGLGTLAKYGVLLVIEIFKAGFGVIPTILTGDADVQTVTYHTPLEDELLIDILANSITLTPGTVTIDKKGKKLLILSISGVETTREAIPTVLEDVLLDYETHTTKKRGEGS